MTAKGRLKSTDPLRALVKANLMFLVCRVIAADITVRKKKSNNQYLRCETCGQYFRQEVCLFLSLQDTGSAPAGSVVMVRIPGGHHLVVDCLLLHLEDPGEPELHQELQEELPEVRGEVVGDVLDQPVRLRPTLRAA